MTLHSRVIPTPLYSPVTMSLPMQDVRGLISRLFLYINRYISNVDTQVSKLPITVMLLFVEMAHCSHYTVDK